MKILIVGSGGREHAIGMKLLESPRTQELYFAPGNGGTATIGTNLPIKADEIEKLKDFALREKIDLTIVGPEVPLMMGITDLFQGAGLRIFGPDKKGARLEASKSFAKEFMEKYKIPTGAYKRFTDSQEALAYLQKSDYPAVIKADGLAAGKGVVICEDYETAEKAIKEIMEDKIFGDQGSTIIIEEFLEGKEVSLLCFTDSKAIVPMASASDYKKAYDHDQGPNTGGMGCISPSPYYEEGSCDHIAQKTLGGIQKEGMDVKGEVYIGLIMTKDGPKVLEYNMRFGDPETEVLLIRMETDLAEIIDQIIDKNLSKTKIKWTDQKALTVIMAAKGYPGTPQTGSLIHIPETPEGVYAYHAGTRLVDGKVISSGGRVLAISALGQTMEEARKKAYGFIEQIEFPKSFYRKDIGE